MRFARHASLRRRAAWVVLVAGVAVVHALLATKIAANTIGWNARPQPRRIEVALVKRLQPTAPPRVAAAAAAPAPRPPGVRAVHVARAASAPLPAVPASSSREVLKAEALALAASMAQAARPAASVASALAAASAASAGDERVASTTPSPVAGPPREPFRWPPSTRLVYNLKGMRHGGNLYGSAVVEWARQDAHYQVQFDIHITPFIDQHLFSDGRIVDDGLSPRHYSETYKMILSDPKVRTIEFGDDLVTLTDGTRVRKMPGTQDGASQFVQFVWLFATHPELLRSGNVVDIPLALMNSLRMWHYQVLGMEQLAMSFGPIDAIHLKPVLDGPRRPNEYPFEIWMAPSLQYLPVRILITIDDRTWADLTLDGLPLQAAPADEMVPAASSPS